MMSPFGVALQRLMESEIPAVPEPHDLEHNCLRSDRRKSVGKPHAHVLGNLLGFAREGRDLRDRLQNEMQVADRNALGEQHLQNALKAGMRNLRRADFVKQLA